MTECVAVLNSYHMAITTNTTKESGPQHQVLLLWLLPDIWHQHTGGVQPQLSFLVYWGGWASIMGDREAVKESGLSELVEKLPGLLYCIGDCAYTPTEHLIPIYGADNTTKTRYDNYNFYASQL